MYFKSRAEAGRKLAKKLQLYRTKNCVVLAMSPGGVLIGAQIAIALHADLFMLANEKIMLPGEPVAFGAVSANNTFTYNSRYSNGVLDELKEEYYNLIEAERLEKLHKLNSVLGPDGEVPHDMLRRRVVILVSDGFMDSFELDVAADFLKPIDIKRLVIAAPLASIDAVDCMHLRGDEIECLNVVEDVFDVNHYFDDNTVPDVTGLHKIIRNTPLNWHLD